MSEKIRVRAVRNCMFCLGSGLSVPIFAVGDYVCKCITEQLEIIVVDKKDYNISSEDRYKPGEPSFIKESRLSENERVRVRRAE